MSCCCDTVERKLTLDVRQSECRCGATVPLLSTLHETVSSYRQCRCLQLFLGNPETYDCRVVTKEDKERTRKYCQETDSSFYVHCPYLANLAKPDCSRAVSVLSKELDVVAGLPAACVLHIGKVGTLENVAQRINDLLAHGHLPISNSKRVPYHLLLEIAAGQGTELGRSWEEIRKLYEALDYTRVGLCIDTQHAFASGMCRFETHEDVVKLFEESYAVLRKGVSLIHLNDSKKPFGSQVDRHEVLKQGYIWSASDVGLKALLRMAKEAGTDIVSETEDPFSDIAFVENYLKDKTE